MDRPPLSLEPAETDDLDYVVRLLRANDLPAEDVRTKPGSFYIGYGGPEPVGIGGVERYGRDGLVRSIVVESASRGQGFGTALCDALEATARSEGVRTVYLLTTTAADFFTSRGYDEIERTEAPTAIQETTEFTDFCPTSAACMAKRL